MGIGFNKMFRRSRVLVGAGLMVALVQSAFALDVVSGDFQQILKARSDVQVVWQLADNPNIYIFDSPGLNLQGRTFNRITQFTEQQVNQPYPTVLNDLELNRYYEAVRRTLADFAFGHDVLISELVKFFNFASRDKIELTQEEIALRGFLIDQGLVRFWRGFYQSMKPDVVVLSIPQVQSRKPGEPMITEDARYVIFTHELAHGEYYSNSHYAKYCQRFWAETLTENQREAFKKFLASSNYAVDDEELLKNEMQAYLMFTHDPRSFSARKLGVSEAELQGMRDAFRRGKPPTRMPLFPLGGL